MKKLISLTLVIVFLTGCALMSDRQRTTAEGVGAGALLGAAVGALLGQSDGKDTESTIKGALIGALSGGIIGYSYHKLIAKRKAELVGKKNNLNERIKFARDINELTQDYYMQLKKELEILIASLKQHNITSSEFKNEKKKLLKQVDMAEKDLELAKRELAELQHFCYRKGTAEFEQVIREFEDTIAMLGRTITELSFKAEYVIKDIQNPTALPEPILQEKKRDTSEPAAKFIQKPFLELKKRDTDIYMISSLDFEKTELEPVLRLNTGGHTSIINDLAITSDKRYLISASDDKTIRVWDTKTKKEVRKILGQIDEACGKIHAIALSPNDKYLAVSGYLDYTSDPIRIYDFPTGRLVGILRSHADVIYDLAFSTDGRYLVSASQDFTVKVWDVLDNFKLLHTFHEHKDFVYAVRIFPHKEDYQIVSAGFDKQVILYSLKQKKVLSSFFHKDKADSLAVSHKYIASAGYDHKINIFDLNLQHIKTINSETDPTGLSFSSDGKMLIAGTGTFPLNCNVYDTEQNFKKIQSFPMHDNLTSSVAFLDNETAVTTGGNNMDIYFWNPYTGRIKGHIEGEGKIVWSVGVSGDKIAFGNTSAYQKHNNRGKWEKVFNLTSSQISQPKDFFGFHRIPTQYKNYSLSHKKGGPYGLNDAVLSIETEGNTVHIVRDANNGIRHRTYGFTPQGYILSGGASGFLTAYNLEGKEIANFVGHTGEIWTIAADGDWLVSSGNDQVIKIWNLKALQEKKGDIFPTLNLFVSKSNEYVVWTEEGFFDASPGGVKFIGYHINQGQYKEAEFVEVDQFYDLFYRPDLVAKRLEGGHEDEILTELDRIGDISAVLESGLPPVLELLSQSEIMQTKREFTLDLKITDRGGGIGKIVYRVNGITVGVIGGARPVDVPGRRRGVCKRRFTLSHGKNVITAKVCNAKGKIESKLVKAIVYVDDPLIHRPDLYVLAVGITNYLDYALRLKYAAKDAQAFAEELKIRGKPLFKSVKAKTLLNNEATIANISSAFNELSKKIRQSDVFVFYMAGHGMTLDGNYHFIPYELRYENTDIIREKSLSHNKLQRLLAEIPALKSLIILDTCNSGAFATLASRGLAEKTAIDKLMRATGRVTLAASSDTQLALEGFKGHGVFTYAILRGLQRHADHQGNRDGATSIDELSDFIRQEVPRITYDNWGYEQIPMRSLHGDSFPIGCRQGFSLSGCKSPE